MPCPSTNLPKTQRKRVENSENLTRISCIDLPYFLRFCLWIYCPPFTVPVAFSMLQYCIYLMGSKCIVCSCEHILKYHLWVLHVTFSLPRIPLNVPVCALRPVRSTLDTKTQKGMRSGQRISLQGWWLHSATA